MISCVLKIFMGVNRSHKGPGCISRSGTASTKQRSLMSARPKGEISQAVRCRQYCSPDAAKRNPGMLRLSGMFFQRKGAKPLRTQSKKLDVISTAGRELPNIVASSGDLSLWSRSQRVVVEMTRVLYCRNDESLGWLRHYPPRTLCVCALGISLDTVVARMQRSGIRGCC